MMMMILIWDATQRLLEMCKLPNVAMRWEEESEAHVLVIAFWKRRPLSDNSSTAPCPSALVSLSVQQYIFLTIFVSCLFHFRLKNCHVTCSVLYCIVSVLQFEILVMDRLPEHFIYFIWGNCSHLCEFNLCCSFQSALTAQIKNCLWSQNHCHKFWATGSQLMFNCCCSRERNHVIGLMKRFPNLDLEAVKQQFPSTDIDKIRYNKKTRGHRENICWKMCDFTVCWLQYTQKCELVVFISKFSPISTFWGILHSGGYWMRCTVFNIWHCFEQSHVLLRVCSIPIGKPLYEIIIWEHHMLLSRTFSKGLTGKMKRWQWVWCVWWW